MTSNWATELDQLSAMANLARQVANAPVATEVHREGRERIVAIALTTRHRRRLSMATTKVLVAGAALAAAWVLWLVRPRPIQYEVVGGSGLDGPYVSAPPAAPVDLRFSDGSDVRGEAGSRLRVDETNSHGARVLLERGAASSHVAHHHGTNWTFVAGPFEVRVIGTRFDLSWDPLAEEFDLVLREGSVEVRSPLAAGPILVRAGQRFRAALAKRSMIVSDLDTALQPAPSPDPAPQAPAASQPDSTPALAAPPANAKTASSARRESWQEMIGHGDFEGVVGAATARGIDGCVSSCNAGDLRSLADAARYTNRSELADRCLLSLRRRFQSAAAAFLLGRTHEGQSPSAAVRWYDTYLSESPDGEFAAEALAGKMRSIATERGQAAAKPLAIEYLRRYPQGVHVKIARKVAGLD